MTDAYFKAENFKPKNDFTYEVQFMKKLAGGEILFLALVMFLSVLAGCSNSPSDDPATETGYNASEQPGDSDNEALLKIESYLSQLQFPDNSENSELLDRITAKLGLINIEDEELVSNLEAELKRLIETEYEEGLANSANRVLAKFESLLDESLLPDPGEDTEPVAVEGVDPDAVRVLVSDGITRKGAFGAGEEIIPYAVVYALSNAKSDNALGYLLAKKVEGALVQFSYKNQELGVLARWRKLGEPLITDGKGLAVQKCLSPYLSEACFPTLMFPEQKDILLKAEVILPEKTVTDDNAFIRVLSTYEDLNHDAILTDHDNTLHETGGSNTLNDVIDAAHVLKKEWPVMDACVVREVEGWMDEGNDLVIVSGLPHQLRGKAREQMTLHFNDSPRRIPMILEKDTPYDDMREFKAGIIKTLKNLYGGSHVKAMVGDTVSQDGYGALANGVFYAPYMVNYKANPDRLDTIGYGKIDPNTIAMDWSEVMEMIETGSISKKNFWIRNNAFLNIAHRGGGELAPEDTLVAYRNAVSVGADAIEGDCHRTKDGIMVVSHDSTVDRCTDGTGAIEDLTFDEIRALDAGYRYTADGGATYPFRGKGIKIPTVEEVFKMLTTDLSGVPMILEIKTENNRAEAVSLVLDLIEKYDGGTGDLINRLQMGAFNQEALDYIYEMGKDRGMELIRCYSTEGVIEFLTTPVSVLLDPEYVSPGDVLALPWALVMPSVMKKARETGTNANVWTVNDKFHMKWLKNVMKVDGIMTDNPALLEEVIKEDAAKK